MEGTPFGRYQLIELIGRGGMGEVWRAYDSATQRVVAVKVLPANLAGDPQFAARFRREAFTAARLNDPHVVPIHNFGEIDGRLYVDMRLIKGRDLQAILAHGRLEPQRAVKVVDQVASALDEAHGAGLVHRDVKPSNILLTDNDFAYLIDFGIARAAGDPSLTGTGNVIGTWAYLAPERFSGGTIDPRADIYALACVLYECLTGSQPFPGTTIEQQVSGHMTAPPPRPSAVRGDVPATLDTVIATGMAKSPDHRYRSVRQMAEAAQDAITQPTRMPDAPRQNPLPPQGPYPPNRTPDPRYQPPLNAWQQPPAKPQRSLRLLWAGAVAVIAVVAVVAAIVLMRPDSQGDPPLGNDGSSSTAPTDTGTPLNEGPFTGTYDVTFAEPTSLTGGSVEAPAAPDETWAVRSLCRDSGCVATVNPAGDQSSLIQNEFDDIDGHWLSVGVTNTGVCQDQSGVESWTTVSLLQRPDGNLVGEMAILYPLRCAQKYAVTLTRTGDVEKQDHVPDPAELAPRVPSDAQALHGRYHFKRTHANNADPYETDFSVRTDCLRTGERCMSFFYSPDDSVPLVFADGKWVADYTWAGVCPAGGDSVVTIRADYPMPQPAQNPITELTGHGSKDETAPACADTGIDETFTRTGD